MSETVFTLREAGARFRRQAIASVALIVGPSLLAVGAAQALNWQHLPPAKTAQVMALGAALLLALFLVPLASDYRLWRARGGRDLVLRADGVELPAYMFQRLGKLHQLAGRSPEGALFLAWRDVLGVEVEGDVLQLATEDDDDPWAEPVLIRLDELEAPREELLAAIAARR